MENITRKKLDLVKFRKIKNIYYSYHISNFLAGLVISQKNLKSQYIYFYTKFLHRFVKALVKIGLVSSIKVFQKNFDTQLKNFFLNSDSIRSDSLEWSPDFFPNFAYNLKKVSNLSCLVTKKKIITNSIVKKDRPYLVLNLKYNNEKPLVGSVFMYSRPGRRLFINYYTLDKLAKLNPGSTIFISNSYYGIIDHISALRLGIGGLLICKIN